MVLLRVVAALKNDIEELSKLSQCISGVVHVGLRLSSVSRCDMGKQMEAIPNRPSSA
jgi:hypothetical protein